jgi:hypothetical protein
MATRRSIAVLLLMLGTSACGTAGPWPVDGMWTASSDGMGGELTLVIKTQGINVTGEARQGRGTLESAPLSLSGSYRAPTLQIKLTAPDGAVWSLAAKVTGRETMNGTLTWPTGTVQPLSFVRP